MRAPVLMALGILLIAAAALIVTDAATNPHATDPAAAIADSDGDGIEDSVDDCPFTAEDADGVDDLDGCPDSDAEIVSLSFPHPLPVVLNQATPIVVGFEVANGNFPGDLHVLLQVSMPASCPADWQGELGDQVAGFNSGGTHFSIVEFDLLSVAAGASNSLSRTMAVVCSTAGSSGTVLASVTTQGDVNAPNPVREEDSSNNVLSAPATAGEDADSDGVPDDNDNCPNTPNPTQANSDAGLNAEGVTIYGPVVPADSAGDACDDDDDNDSPASSPADWIDDVEFYLTNDPLAQTEACPRTVGVDDYWMPDTNIDQATNSLDLIPFKIQFLNAAGAPGSASRRMDLNMDGSINSLDLIPFKRAFQASCTVP